MKILEFKLEISMIIYILNILNQIQCQMVYWIIQQYVCINMDVVGNQLFINIQLKVCKHFQKKNLYNNNKYKMKMLFLN